MGMTIQDDMWEAAKMLPEKQRAPFVYALVAYGMDGAEPKGSPGWLPVFHVIRDRLRLSAEASERGRSMARARWDKVREQNAAASPKHMQQHMHEHDACDVLVHDAEYESEIEDRNPPIVPPYAEVDFDAPAPSANFSLQCLAALTEVSGQTYTTMPAKCRRELERAESRFTADQVRAMIEFKREEWRAKDARDGTTFSRNLTPNTLFSPDHFEQYMGQSMAHREEAGRYADYD